MKRSLAVALFVMVLTICYIPSAQAFTFTDDFSGGINSYWWTASANGNSVDATGGNIKIEQKNSGAGAGAGLGFNFIVTGDFIAQVDYTLNGPIVNGERIGISSTLGAVERIGYSRTNDWQAYLTHFGDGVVYDLSGTNDIQGTLRFSRIDSTLSGSFWNGSGWTLIHSWDSPGNVVGANLGFSIWPLDGVANGGTVVTFDNFSLNAPTMVDPRGTTTVPEPASLLLLGFGLVGIAGATRKLKK